MISLISGKYDGFSKGGETVIEFQNVTKTYRVMKRQAGFGSAVKALFSREHETIQALCDVSFTVGDGEIVGYIGPNGAGKSTTVKIMCGILTPDSGRCLVNGRVPWRERTAHTREIGVVFGQRSQLWWDVPVIDSFELLRDMYRVEPARYKRNLDALAALLGLGELLKAPARTLSLGQRMRCEIAASLLHDPKTIFLDEPTIGLDAASKLEVRRFIREQNRERGTTVVLTTHDMQDIEALASRVLLIGKGQLLLDGSLDTLRRRVSGKKKIVVRFGGAGPALCPGLTLTACRAGELELSLDPAVLTASDAVAHLAAGAALTDVTVSEITAEEMVAALYREYRI